MKLADLFAKDTPNSLFNGRMKALGLLGGLALAGATLLATPAAGAQQFGVAVQFGGPRYVAPAPRYIRPYAPGYTPGYVTPAYGAPVYGYDPGYVEREHINQWRAHEYWEHHRDFGGRPVPYRGW